MFPQSKQTSSQIQRDADNSIGLDKVQSLAGEHISKRDFREQNCILNPRQRLLTFLPGLYHLLDMSFPDTLPQILLVEHCCYKTYILFALRKGIISKLCELFCQFCQKQNCQNMWPDFQQFMFFLELQLFSIVQSFTLLLNHSCNKHLSIPETDLGPRNTKRVPRPTEAQQKRTDTYVNKYYSITSAELEHLIEYMLGPSALRSTTLLQIFIEHIQCARPQTVSHTVWI